MEIEESKLEELIEKRVDEKLQEMKNYDWICYRLVKDFIDTLPKNHCLRLLNLTDFNCKENKIFLEQLEQSFKLMSRDNTVNNNWFKTKLDEIRSVNDRKQVSSNLGEIRAYGILKLSEFGNNLKCMSGKGCDFKSVITRNNKKIKVNIEVNTPLGRDDPKKTTLDFGTSKEIAPFGLPKRKIDSIGSEVISKINSIKEDEEQFEEDAVNILYVDYVNPFLCKIDLLSGHFNPFMLFSDNIFTGNFWFAMYSKKNEYIPFEIPLSYPQYDKPYKMEYNGKLTKKSKLDFVIANSYDGLYIYEKIARHHFKIDKLIYLALFSIADKKLENNWINYPCKDLNKRVKKMKKYTKRFYKTYSLCK